MYCPGWNEKLQGCTTFIYAAYAEAICGAQDLSEGSRLMSNAAVLQQGWQATAYSL